MTTALHTDAEVFAEELEYHSGYLNGKAAAMLRSQAQEIALLEAESARYVIKTAIKVHKLREALMGVIRVADRKTDEFDAARAALEETK